MGVAPTSLMPDAKAMQEHVEHLFGGYLGGCHEGLVELAWTDPVSHKLSRAELFGTDRLDDLVARALTLNAGPDGCNVYIGAALRRPETAPFGRASDADFFALTAAYVDLDEPGAATAAKDKYGTAKPTRVVVTGSLPYPRAQLWWLLDEPIVDPRLSEGLLRGMALKLDGDPTVVNPSRVMRLAGGIAWPVKPGRVIEATRLITPNPPLAANYDWAHLARLFPGPQPTESAEPSISIPGDLHFTPAGIVLPGPDGVTRKETLFGLPGEVIDGREAYMLKTLTACLIQLIAETGETPLPQALFDLAWPQFAKGCDVTKPRANGQPWTAQAFAQKVTYTLGRFAAGKIQGCRTTAEAQAIGAAKQAAYEAGGGQGKYYDRSNPGGYTDFGSDPGGHTQKGTLGPLFEVLNVPQILAMPDPKWLVDGMVIEQSLGFLYGPPGCLKTFIALDMALAITTGQPAWWNRKISQPGAVIYISTEGLGNLKFRLMAWEQHRGVVIKDAPFRLIRQGINFTSRDDIVKLLDTVQSVADSLPCTISAVFVDTVSRVLPGVDENQQKDMTIFVAGCDAVRQRFSCVVVGLHHTNKMGSIRGSTVLPGAGDFMIEVKREPGALTGSIRAEKIKDAEDGWEQFFEVTKIDLPTIGQHTSLVVDPSDAPRRGDGLPDRDRCREILEAIDQQWRNGAPWCYSKISARCAETNISRRWNIERKIVARLLEEWNAKGVIVEEILDARKRIKGYRKLIEI